MRPAFVPGDRLYVDPTPDRPIAPGDVIALWDPEHAGRLLLKRVVRIGVESVHDAPPGGEGTVHVEGDNAGASRDSRQFGDLPEAAVIGVVWYRYAPGPRRGPIPPRHV